MLPCKAEKKMVDECHCYECDTFGECKHCEDCPDYTVESDNILQIVTTKMGRALINCNEDCLNCIVNNKDWDCEKSKGYYEGVI